MRILVITSCTGEKSVESPRALTLADFRLGPAQVREREAEHAGLMRPAEELYSGQQHVRLMRGVAEYRTAHSRSGVESELDLRIVSAGYGIVRGAQKLAPYEATFQGMGKADLRAWADSLGVPQAFRDAVAEPYDLGLVLLGDDYLAACRLDAGVTLGGPTLLFCGKNALKRLPKLANLHPVPVSNAEAKRFSCGLVALKGELGSRILSRLALDPGFATTLTSDAEVLDLLDQSAPVPGSRRAAARPKSDVDYVIALPPTWNDKPHRSKLRYFIPEWDDLVDRDYDFENDVHSGGTGDWSNEVYAHQLYPEPNYDGLLISKVVAEKSRKKKERINELGVHRYLRVPREFPVMGDCGAFGYIAEKVPPYTTDEILDYYTRLDFDFGVSIDHLIVTATEAEKRERYDLTIENAAEFLQEHRKAKLPWTPIGAVQGWDARSYAAAARQYVQMGYDYIALGGLVRTATAEILKILEEVHEVVPSSVQLHLFGLARLSGLSAFSFFGVSSVDSASFLRQAWMRTTTSYVMPGESYAALRIPEAGKSFRAKRMTDHAELDEARILKLEQEALRSVRSYAKRKGTLDAALNGLLEYDRFVTADRVDLSAPYLMTLERRPWEECGCAICIQAGVEVVIFRGNNRNRRRGFHNTFVFYRLLEQALRHEPPSLVDQQLDLPLASEVA